MTNVKYTILGLVFLQKKKKKNEKFIFESVEIEVG